MSGNGDQFQIRRILPGTEHHYLALHRVLDIQPPPAGAAPAPRVADLLAGASCRPVSIDLLLGAYRGDELLSACLAVEAPGGTAMVFASSHLQQYVKYRATVAVLQALQKAAWQRPIALLEVLVPPEARALSGVLCEAGFRYLTRLRYLRRRVSRGGLAHAKSHGGYLEWVQYTPDREPLFQDAVERTYVHTLDCPELAGLRRTADVLAGHRAAGLHDPALWWVAMGGREPIGVILLSRIPSERALEVVYMGVAQPARGTGVADALLERAVDAAVNVGASVLALGVDERNTPARRMYARWGFVETGARDAWIATPLRA